MRVFTQPLFIAAGLSALLVSALIAPVFAQDDQPSEMAEAAAIGIVGARLGYSTTDGPVAGLSFKASDIGKRGANLLISAEASRNDRNINFSLGFPPASPERGSFGLDIYRNETEVTRAFGFATLSYGLNPYWTKSLSENSTLTIGLDVSRDTISDLVPNSSALIVADSGSRDKVAFDVGFDYSTDTLLATVSGGLIYGSTSGRSLRVEGSVTKSWTQPDAPVFLVTTLSFGNLASFSGNSHIGDRFVLGQGLLRGFDYGGFGPRDLAAGNATLGGNSYAGFKVDAYFPHLLPNQENLVIGGFLDVGSLWGLDSTAGGLAGLDPVDDSMHMRSSIGIGAKYKLGVGSVNLYLSKPLKKQTYDHESTLQLSIDASF